MRTKKAIYNTVTSILMQLATFAVGLIIPRLIISTYGSSVNGLVASIAQFIGYLYIIEMGIGGALTFSLYKPLVADDKIGINRILSAAKQSYNRIGLYFTGFVVLIMFIYPLFVLEDGITYGEVVLLVTAIGSASIVNYFTSAKYNVLLVASQANYVISIVRILFLIVNTGIMVALIQADAPYYWVYLGSVVAYGMQAFLLMAYTKRKHPYIDFKVEPDMAALSNKHNVLVHQLSGMVVFGSPILLLTLFTSLRDVSIYSIYAMVFTGINMIIGVFNNGFTAGFGQLIAQDNKHSLRISYSQYEYLFYIILTFAYSCVLILGLPFIHVYTTGISDTNYVDRGILILFIAVGVLNNWKIPQSTLIISAGHFRQTRHRAIIEAAVTLTASATLVLLYGLKGVLVGSLIGLAYRSIDLFYARRIADIPFLPTLLRLIRIFVAAAIAVLPFSLFITIEPDNFLQWIGTAIGVSIWVFIVVIAVNWLIERTMMKAIISRISRVFQR